MVVSLSYYNEIDTYAARWLENLVAAEQIVPGRIDVRSIHLVTPENIRDSLQAHFFAGIGVWSYALRKAGWPDGLSVWTGSCPCQPFSSAGKKKGFNDERHLWPIWFALIQQCHPPVIVGEQVASPDGLTWLDLVQTDLENQDYAFAAIDTCAAGFGAPHIRQRLYWVAVTRDERLEGIRLQLRERAERSRVFEVGRGGEADRMGDPRSAGSGRDSRAVPGEEAQGEGEGCRAWSFPDQPLSPGAVNGFWADAEGIFCKDGKFRPVEPGLEPLAYGPAEDVGRLRSSESIFSLEDRYQEAARWQTRRDRLRGYGNALCAEQAVGFVRAVIDTLERDLNAYSCCL